MWIAQVQRDGFAIVRGVLTEAEVADCVALIESGVASETAGARRGGTRDVLGWVPALGRVAEHARVREIVKAVLGDGAVVVRATLFDKTPGANWKVPWHQDLTIAVEGRVERDGYGPWSVKNGVMHVQPPSEVLERMVTVRLHLDPCPVTNGALRVMPGTHGLGRLDQNDVSGFVEESAAVVCAAGAGSRERARECH